jgi:hypothetical protein
MHFCRANAALITTITRTNEGAAFNRHGMFFDAASLRFQEPQGLPQTLEPVKAPKQSDTLFMKVV